VRGWSGDGRKGSTHLVLGAGVLVEGEQPAAQTSHHPRRPILVHTPIKRIGTELFSSSADCLLISRSEQGRPGPGLVLTDPAAPRIRTAARVRRWGGVKPKCVATPPLSPKHGQPATSARPKMPWARPDASSPAEHPDIGGQFGASACWGRAGKRAPAPDTRNISKPEARRGSGEPRRRSPKDPPPPPLQFAIQAHAPPIRKTDQRSGTGRSRRHMSPAPLRRGGLACRTAPPSGGRGS
jgi:hypothetical protein